MTKIQPNKFYAAASSVARNVHGPFDTVEQAQSVEGMRVYAGAELIEAVTGGGNPRVATAAPNYGGSQGSKGPKGPKGPKKGGASPHNEDITPKEAAGGKKLLQAAATKRLAIVVKQSAKLGVTEAEVTKLFNSWVKNHIDDFTNGDDSLQVATKNVNSITAAELAKEILDTKKGKAQDRQHKKATDSSSNDAAVQKLMAKLGITEDDLHLLARLVAKSNRTGKFNG